MTVPPVQVAGSPFQSAWTGTGSKTGLGGGFSIDVGGVIVILGTGESQVAFGSAPTNAGSATFTFTQRGLLNTASFCEMSVYSAVCTGAGTVSISWSNANNNWGMWMAGFLAANHGGVGAVPAATNGTSAAPTLTATWAANSFVAALVGDFAAVAITGRAYRANIGTATEVNAQNVDGNYSTYAFYHPDSGAGGSAAVGMTAPSTQTYSLGAVEVLGTAGATASPYIRTFNAIPFIGGGL